MNVRDAKALQVIPQTKLRSSMPRASDAISCAKSLYDRLWRKAAGRQRLWYIDPIPSYCRYDGDQRLFGRPAFLRSRYNGGSFACGEAPRWNASMMSMRPPQQRHGCESSASSARRRSFADWEQWNIRERLKGREFKDLGVAAFRTKPERQLRNAAYAQERNCVSSASFRYRVKANYRDAIYLAYGTSVPDLLSEFIDDLLTVLSGFATMAGAYPYMRVGKAAWNDFVDDLDKKRSITVSPKDIW